MMLAEEVKEGVALVAAESLVASVEEPDLIKRFVRAAHRQHLHQLDVIDVDPDLAEAQKEWHRSPLIAEVYTQGAQILYLRHEQNARRRKRQACMRMPANKEWHEWKWPADGGMTNGQTPPCD